MVTFSPKRDTSLNDTFFYYRNGTSYKVFVELLVRRKVCSSNTFSSKSHLVEFFPELSSGQISGSRHVVY